MQELAQLVVVLVAYYVTFGIMGVGFGMMLAGTEGAAAAGNFFFVQPLRWIVSNLWFAGAALLAASFTFVLHRVVDPFILAVERVVVGLITRERGWLRRR